MNDYKQIFLDFDGVICDSNSIKAKNIFDASRLFVNEYTAKKFTEYFIKNNGLPRELKTIKYFNNKIISDNILLEYEKLNSNLIEAKLIPGLLKFLNIYKVKNLFILSGGSKIEVKKFLLKNEIIDFFDETFCGPQTKEQNLKNLNIMQPALFIGDSQHDYEVAQKFQLDFIFMYEVTQVVNWKRKMSGIRKTKNFTTLLENIFDE